MSVTGPDVKEAQNDHYYFRRTRCTRHEVKVKNAGDDLMQLRTRPIHLMV